MRISAARSRTHSLRGLALDQNEARTANPADPPCGTGFTGNKPHDDQASWYHADETQGGPCNHGGNIYSGSGSGHPGTVTVEISNPFWTCSASYFGTQGADGTPTGQGPTPDRWHRKKPPF